MLAAGLRADPEVGRFARPAIYADPLRQIEIGTLYC
jgi:hypothetical protein